jgi:hypothetical protein
MVTVVLPTVNRPEMLRQALQSVAAQTARDRIGTVLVSENGGKDESRKVCVEFPELPIEYAFRQPATTALEHGRVLLTEGLRDEYAAILHDDDWWMPNHLANCLDALESHPDATACFSSFFNVSPEQGRIASSDWHVLWWIGANYPPLETLWKLGRNEAAMAAFLGTPGHYSALVARRSALESAFKVVAAAGNAHDNDRMFVSLLAKHGPLLYLPLPDVYVRTHVQQDSNIEWERRCALMSATTNWIFEHCQSEGIDLDELVMARLRSAPKHSGAQVRSCFSAPWFVEHGRKLMASVPSIAEVAPVSWAPPARPGRFDGLKKVIRDLTPPAAYRLLSGTKRRIQEK